MTKIAITGYVDNQDRFVRETNMMTYSGMSLDSRFTFVLYVHPSVINQIVIRDNVVVIPHTPSVDPFLLDYPFAKSLAFFDTYLYEYDYILKTDTDVFFTEKLNNFAFDNKIYCGPGHYIHNEQMKLDLEEYAHRFGYLNYKHVSQKGPTLIGPTKDILNILKKTYDLNKNLYYSMPDGIWLETIYKMVSSLYATEIVLSDYSVEILNTIDVKSNNKEPVGNIMHIHCFHTDDLYSKFAEQRGEYNHAVVLEEDTVSNYCLKMSVLSKAC